MQGSASAVNELLNLTRRLHCRLCARDVLTGAPPKIGLNIFFEQRWKHSFPAYLQRFHSFF